MVGFRADLWPNFKSSYVLIIIVTSVALLTGVVIMSVAFCRDIDLYRHGVIREGTVKSVELVQEQHGKGRKSYAALFYRHKISYADFEMQIEQRAKMKEGSNVEVYYSTENPANAVLKAINHPFKSMSDVMATQEFRKLAWINIFLVALKGILIFGFRRAKPDPQL